MNSKLNSYGGDFSSPYFFINTIERFYTLCKSYVKLIKIIENLWNTH